MDFISEIWSKAKKLNKTIVLPESDDPRILKAAEIINQLKLARIILVGKEVDPKTSPDLDQFTQILYEKRKYKGLTLEKARKTLVEDYSYFGAMMVGQGKADGMVCGASLFTASTIRAALHCVGLSAGNTLVSSFFIMIHPNQEFGENGIIFFADCGVVPNPNVQQLAEIARQTGESFIKFIGKEPKVAMLSFSTKGSAKHPDAEKVIQAAKIAQEKNLKFLIDGELQLDAALIPAIGAKKAPGSPVAGNANVLIFPDLDAGNIGCKIAERLGGAKAVGPILQGIAKPINDLSRGCSVEDIVNVVAITAVQ